MKEMFFIFLIFILCGTDAQKSDGCDPIPASLTAPRTGVKAFDKCIEYQERFVYPCEESSTPGGTSQRGNYCKNETLASNDSDNSDIGHVVSLGFGPLDDIKWLCAGTIISDRYILTAAHCTASFQYGPPHSVYIGEPVQTKDIDRSKLYKVKTTIKHPDYNKPIKYHDITLLETENSIELNNHVRPACLHTGEPLNYGEATLFSRNFGQSDTQPHDLLKLKLTKLSEEECSKEFPSYRLMKQGFVDDWQICYLNKNMRQESYRFDAGSPLQAVNDKVNCMVTVIGVTSFGKTRTPELIVFTRVSHYLPWIESVVWP